METGFKSVYNSIRGTDASAIINRRLHKIQDTLGLLNAIELAKASDRRAASLIYVMANSKGQRYDSHAFQVRWMKLIKKAIARKLISESFTFHDLRDKAGSDAKTCDAQDLLGHASSATTRRVYMRKPIVVTPIR